MLIKGLLGSEAPMWCTVPLNEDKWREGKREGEKEREGEMKSKQEVGVCTLSWRGV